MMKKKNYDKCCHPIRGNAPSCIYGLGWLGAVVYYWQVSPDFGAKLWGIFKAMVWPAMLVYKALELLNF
jgi:hypothetical protein